MIIIRKSASARMITALQESAYCCFLPDLAGLGGACPHGSWQRQKKNNILSQKIQGTNNNLSGYFLRVLAKDAKYNKDAKLRKSKLEISS